ncbi:hypothetical protein PHMEG_00012884 [Phytophthora megakarya]|uniref:Uncharacterized protein n=1 Tax=Phytophthora megakarya TaxID=4795 RepID=A0A225W838_9STRA|nr:hypothetical protein PHMEG_00012884 [Phytophthora megakarya]
MIRDLVVFLLILCTRRRPGYTLLDDPNFPSELVIRFIRVKTSDEQALPRYLPAARTGAGLDHTEVPVRRAAQPLASKIEGRARRLTESIPLDLLDDNSTLISTQARPTNCFTCAKPVTGINALVNRLLVHIAGPAEVEDALTSHSFRRGAWSLATTSQAFAYVFNIPKDVHQVAKVLSRISPRDVAVLPSLGTSASVTQEWIREVSCKLFNASHGLDNKAFNLSSTVIDVLTATITRHYPSGFGDEDNSALYRSIWRDHDMIADMITATREVNCSHESRCGRYNGRKRKG